MQLSVTAIDTYLRQALLAERLPPGEQGGLYHPSERPVERLGLALEPTPRLPDWVRSQHLDALWLHRPWRLDLTQLPPDVGILYHHLPFDEHLTTGLNPRLAGALGMTELEELGYKQASDEAGNLMPPRPIGMIGHVPERTFGAWRALIGQQFGGYDRAEPGQIDVFNRVAVVGAMNPALVQEAHERGVGLYLTGEYRKGTQATVDETGMAVIAIGHRRTEEWGLRALGTLLHERWPGLTVSLLP